MDLTCVYCGAATEEPPCACPGCGRPLTLLVDEDTDLRDLVKALYANDYRLEVTFHPREEDVELPADADAPRDAHPDDLPQLDHDGRD